MILIKKIKTANKYYLWTFIATLLIYLGSLVFFTKSMLGLTGIETAIRILLTSLFYIFFFLYLLGGPLAIVNKRKIIYTIISILIFLLSIALFFGSYFINNILNSLEPTADTKFKYTTNLVVMKENNFEKDIEARVGMIADENDIEGHVLALKLIEKEKLDKIEIILYEDYLEMLNDLYNDEIDGTFLSGNYIVMFGNDSPYENIENETEVIYSYSELLENADSIISSGKELTEPFTLLIIGVDSTSDSMNASQSFNGDTLMLITFNPHTLSSVVFSIPRDTYVPISCRNNAQAKINSSAYGGTACVVNTIQNLTGIDIDYYVKVNFKGVVELVDALNGIEIDIPIKFCEQDSNRKWGANQLCLNKGLQTINGEEALAFARHRKTLPLSDFQRVQHQQLVVEAIAKKSSEIRNISEFDKILKTINKNIETNMSLPKMLTFYEVGKDMIKNSLNGNDFISIEKTYLTGYSKYIYGAYTYQYFRSSLEEIVDAMKVNLGLQEPKLIKTFSFSGNEEYELKILGKVYENIPKDNKDNSTDNKESKTENKKETEKESPKDSKIEDENLDEPTSNEPIEEQNDDEDKDITPEDIIPGDEGEKNTD